MRLSLAAPAALAALALALQGCGGDGPAPVSTSPPEPAPQASAPAPPPPSAPRPAPAVATGEGLDRGDAAPDFDLPVLGGGKAGRVKLSDHVGPVPREGGPDGVIVGFVASWCGRCTASLPTLAQLEREHGSRLQVLLLAVDEDLPGRLAEAEKVAEKGVRAPVLDALAVPGVQDAWMGEKRNIPRFYLIDRSGTVRVRDTGFGQKMARLLPQQVDFLLNRANRPPLGGGRPSAEPASVDPALGG